MTRISFCVKTYEGHWQADMRNSTSVVNHLNLRLIFSIGYIVQFIKTFQSVLVSYKFSFYELQKSWSYIRNLCMRKIPFLCANLYLQIMCVCGHIICNYLVSLLPPTADSSSQQTAKYLPDFSYRCCRYSIVQMCYRTLQALAGL